MDTLDSWQWIRFDVNTGEINEATDATATHVSIGTYAAAQRKTEDLERRLRQALEANEALDAKAAELENRNSRLFEKQQQTLKSKVHWRNRALKSEGDEPARRLLQRKDEIVARDGQFWGVRVIEVQAGTEAEAVAATQEAVFNKTTQQARINRIRGLGGGEWVAEVHVLIPPTGRRAADSEDGV